MKFSRILFIIGCIAFSSFDSYGQCNGVFADDFESGTSKWTVIGGHTITTTTTSPAVGSYSLQSVGYSAHTAGVMATFPTSQPSTISWWVKSASFSAASGYVVIGNSSITATNCLAFVYFATAGNLSFVSSSTINVKATINTWYFVELRNINWSAKTFDAYVNGALVGTAFPFRSTSVTSIDRVHIYNFSASNTAYYDNFSFGNAKPSINLASKQDITCKGSNDGAINLNVISTTGGLKYNWSNGAVTKNISGLGKGIFTVKVTDSLGCADSAQYTIIEPATVLTATIAGTNLTCNGDSSGLATVTPSGGTAGYTYLWTPYGGKASTAGKLVADTFTVTITDGSNCKIQKKVGISQPPPMAIMPTISNAKCNGDSTGSVFVTVSGGAPAYTYNWPGFSATGPVLNGLKKGSYTSNVIDSKGCKASQTITISEPTKVDLVIKTTPASCFGSATGSATITAMGGTPGYTYSWPGNPGTAATLGNLASGSYMGKVADTNGCVASTAFTITQPTALATAIKMKGVSCKGLTDGSATVLVNGGTPGYTYAWGPGETSSAISGKPIGKYSVIIKDANNCMAQDSVTITEPEALLIVTNKANPSKCNGTNGSINISVYGGTPIYFYKWDNNSTNANLSGLGQGTYKLLLSDVHDCRDSVTVTLTDPAIPPVSLKLNLDTFCTNAPPVTLAGGLPAWGTFSGTGVTGNTFSTTTTGYQKITYSYTDGNSCTGTATDSILVMTCTGPTGIGDPNVENWRIFPNPGNGNFTLTPGGDGEYMVIIRDIQGRQIAKTPLNNCFAGLGIDMSIGNNAKGLFLVEVYNPALVRVFSQKLVVQ